MSVLGCVENYTVQVVSKEGIALGQLQPAGIAWSRVLDGISEATISVAIADPTCCAILGQIHAWHHEVQIFRDGEYVWSGPVIDISGDRDQTTIIARDLFALLDKRIIHNPICFSPDCGGSVADLTDIAKALINDAFAIDGHGYEFFSEPTGLLGERLYQPGETAWTVVQEAMALGLEMTCLGRRIIIGLANGQAPFGATAMLTCADFSGNLEVEEDGNGLATRAISIGNGFVGVATAPGTDINGEHPYYGLIEFVGPSQSELTTQALADAAAVKLISERFPPPLNLVLPTSSALSANAPISIHELVPGVLTNILADCVCNPLQASMVLTTLSVTWGTLVAAGGTGKTGATSSTGSNAVAGEVVEVTYATYASVNVNG